MDITIKDVARKAKVSPTTVSRVLNEHPSVKEQTRKKILAAIREMQYVPNAAAKNLRSQKSSIIGVIVSDINVAYFSEIVKGIQNVAYAKKYKVIICDTEGDKEKELEYLNLLVDRSVDGLILVTSMLTNQEILEIINRGYTVGVVGRNIQHERVFNIHTDNVKAAYEAVEHLILNGHRNIAFISGLAHALDSYDRLEGYLKALKDNGIPFRPELVENGDFTESGGYRAFQRLYEKSIEFSAIFSANDEMALGVYNACKERGIVIPNDVAIVGVDNIRLTTYLNPSLSTIHQPKYEMGYLLAEKLIDYINDRNSVTPITLQLESELIIRDSSNFTRKSPVSM